MKMRIIFVLAALAVISCVSLSAQEAAQNASGDSAKPGSADAAKKEYSAADEEAARAFLDLLVTCLLYTSPSPRDGLLSRMPSSA